MTHPMPFTFIGFMLLPIIDKGGTENISDIKDKLANNNLFSYLREKYEDFDMSLFSKEKLADIEDYFNELAEIVDEERKFDLTENGLCLLLAYCLETIKTDLEDIYPSLGKLYDF